MTRRFVPRPSRTYAVSYRDSSKTVLRVATLLFSALILFVGFGTLLLTNKRLTVGGVPVPIILQFLRDDTARTAYLQKDSRKLHDRLEAMGVESQIKAFYRPQIRDEIELDQYIHQLLYERTGHVGDAYRVNAQVILVLKPTSVDQDFNEWYKLAREAGLVAGKVKREGMQYVITSEGLAIPYPELAAIFSRNELLSLVKMKRL